VPVQRQRIKRVIDLEGGAPADLSSNARVLGDIAGKLGCPLRGSLRPDGSPVTFLIPVAGAGAASTGAFSPAGAARLTQVLIERHVDPAMLAPDYAWNLGGLGDATNVYASAMAMLRSPTESKNVSGSSNSVSAFRLGPAGAGPP